MLDDIMLLGHLLVWCALKIKLWRSQLCHHWWHQRSLQQPLVQQRMKTLALWLMLCFSLKTINKNIVSPSFQPIHFSYWLTTTWDEMQICICFSISKLPIIITHAVDFLPNVWFLYIIQGENWGQYYSDVTSQTTPATCIMKQNH